jgi:hypothetical protein
VVEFTANIAEKLCDHHIDVQSKPIITKTQFSFPRCSLKISCESGKELNNLQYPDCRLSWPIGNWSRVVKQYYQKE